MAAETTFEAMGAGLAEAMAEPVLAHAREAAALDFNQIVSDHRRQVFRFLLASTRDEDLAETLTQECFLKAYRNWASFRGESSVLTWLMRIAINLEKDHWRNRRVQFWRLTRTNAVDADEASSWLPSLERSAEDRLLAKEQVAKLWRVVERLSNRQKTIFLLRYVEEMDLNQIADLLGLSEGTIKAHLSRALTRVRDEMRGKP